MLLCPFFIWDIRLRLMKDLFLLVLFGFASLRGMGTRIMRIMRIEADFQWPYGHFFGLFSDLTPPKAGRRSNRPIVYKITTNANLGFKRLRSSQNYVLCLPSATFLTT
jgi:hypothetical protein